MAKFPFQVSKLDGAKKKIFIFFLFLAITVPAAVLIVLFVFPKPNVLAAFEYGVGYYSSQSFSENDLAMQDTKEYFNGVTGKTVMANRLYDLYEINKEFSIHITPKLDCVKDINNYGDHLKNLKKAKQELESSQNNFLNFYNSQLNIYINSSSHDSDDNYFNTSQNLIADFLVKYSYFNQRLLNIAINCTDVRIGFNQLERAHSSIFNSWQSVAAKQIKDNIEIINIDSFFTYTNKYYNINFLAYYNDIVSYENLIKASTASWLNEFLVNYKTASFAEFVDSKTEAEKIVINSLKTVLDGLVV